MPEWLREEGLGETRFALVEGGATLAARILPDDLLVAGTVVEARLVAVGPRAIARLGDGTEILLTASPSGISEGALFAAEITRPAVPGPEPWKRALGRAKGEGRAVEPPPLATDLLVPPTIVDRLAEAGWDDLLAEASSGRVAFPGGELLIALTPAMTVIDVDGWIDPAALAKAGAAAAARAILRLDIGGNIGIDLPSSTGKAARQAAAEALDEGLSGETFERTAVNGFGFLQLIRPRRRASLLELAQDRAGFAARALLRRAASAGHGPARLAGHPALIAWFERRSDLLRRLERQRGGAVTLRADPTLAIAGGHVEPA